MKIDRDLAHSLFRHYRDAGLLQDIHDPSIPLIPIRLDYWSTCPYSILDEFDDWFHWWETRVWLLNKFPIIKEIDDAVSSTSRRF